MCNDLKLIKSLSKLVAKQALKRFTGFHTGRYANIIPYVFHLRGSVFHTITFRFKVNQLIYFYLTLFIFYIRRIKIPPTNLGGKLEIL